MGERCCGRKPVAKRSLWAALRGLVRPLDSAAVWLGRREGAIAAGAALA